MKMYWRLHSGILLVQVQALSAVNEPPAKSSPHLCAPPNYIKGLKWKKKSYIPTLNDTSKFVQAYVNHTKSDKFSY